MQSLAFIRAAKQMIERIELSNIGSETIEAEREKRAEIQKDLNSLFSGLQNPTLPSAYRLRDAAIDNGFQVSQGVLQRLSQHENLY